MLYKVNSWMEQRILLATILVFWEKGRDGQAILIMSSQTFQSPNKPAACALSTGSPAASFTKHFQTRFAGASLPTQRNPPTTFLSFVIFEVYSYIYIYIFFYQKIQFVFTIQSACGPIWITNHNNLLFFFKICFNK